MCICCCTNVFGLDSIKIRLGHFVAPLLQFPAMTPRSCGNSKITTTITVCGAVV